MPHWSPEITKDLDMVQEAPLSQEGQENPDQDGWVGDSCAQYHP